MPSTGEEDELSCLSSVDVEKNQRYTYAQVEKQLIPATDVFSVFLRYSDVRLATEADFSP